MYEADIPQPRLEMFREDSEAASETLYVAAVPLSMVKDILKEKNLLNKGYDEL